MKLKVHYDGSYTSPTAIGPLVRSTDPDTQSYLFRQHFHQLANKWQRTLQGAYGPHGSYLVEESEPTEKDGGIVEWSRLYAQVPPRRTEGQPYNHTYQFLTSEGGIEEVVLYSSSVLVFDYFETSDTSTIPLFEAFRLFTFGGVTHSVGTPPEPGAPFIIAEDSTLNRWRGTIWERVTRYVRPRVSAAIP
ncbi:MAG TPA: hypothetical protein VF614_01405 [Chthoniobacteraceae bacterium]